jgi:hypothetical protein
MATVGGVVSTAGIVMIACCCSSFMYNFISGMIVLTGIPLLFAVGLPLIAMSSWPFIIAAQTKNIYTKFTGQRSFTPRVSTTGGFNGEDRKLEIAFGCQF